MTTTKTPPTTKPARPWTLSITRDELARRIKRKPARQIATSIGISVSTVIAHLRAFDIPSPWKVGRPKGTKNKPGRRPGSKIPPNGKRNAGAKLSLTDLELVARINAGETEQDIANAYRVTVQAVNLRLRRSGLDYVRHNSAGGSGLKRGSEKWRQRCAKAALVCVAEYARSMRAEHDAEEARAERLQAKVADLEGACREARAAILAGRPFDAVSYLDDVLRVGRTEEAPPVEAKPEIKPVAVTTEEAARMMYADHMAAILDTLLAACGYDTADSTVEPIASVPTTA